MKRRIPFPLSRKTLPYFKEAVEAAQEVLDNDGKILGVEISDDEQGNPVGIIVVDEP